LRGGLRAARWVRAARWLRQARRLCLSQWLSGAVRLQHLAGCWAGAQQHAFGQGVGDNRFFCDDGSVARRHRVAAARGGGEAPDVVTLMLYRAIPRVRITDCQCCIGELDWRQSTRRSAEIEGLRTRTKHSEVPTGVDQSRGTSVTHQRLDRAVHGIAFRKTPEVERHRGMAEEPAVGNFDVLQPSRTRGEARVEDAMGQRVKPLRQIQ